MQATAVYAPCIAAEASWPIPITPEAARRILALLLWLGLISFATVQSSGFEGRQCAPFTIGVSAIDSGDCIGGGLYIQTRYGELP